MQPNKRMSKSTAMLLALGMFGTGAVGSIGYQVFAQTEPINDPTTVSTEVLADPMDEMDTSLVDPVGGDDDGEMDDDNEDSSSLALQATLTEQEVRTIAQDAYAGNGTITQVELEDEDGVIVYGVEFTESDGNEVDVKINAKTGTVVKIEDDRTDSEEDDDGEMDDD